MTDLLDIIKGRRSIRRYEEKDVSEDIVNKILETVQWAPSWTNSQCWEVIVVRDKTIRTNLQGAIPPKNPAIKSIVNSPVVFALCGKLGRSGYYEGRASTKFGDWFMFDIALAAQNICLTAHQSGLGTVIVGLFDHDAAKNVLKIPKGYELVCLIPMGYPAKNPPAPKRKEINEFVHYDLF